MQLDQTHVTIRSRSLTEISDLAMVMIRAYPSALLYGFLMGALPWMVINAALLSWIPIAEYDFATYDEDMYGNLLKYQVWMAILVFLEIPAAGVLTTIYLGQAVFESRPTWRSVFREANKTIWRWISVLGVLRGPLILIVALLPVVGRDMAYEIGYALPILVLVVCALLRANRPFVPEILLLERCPLRVKKDQDHVISLGRRSKALHSPMTGELFGRFLALSMLLPLLAMLGFNSLLWLRGVLFGVWEWDTLVYVLLYPFSLWAAAGLSVLIRFLSYLDTRIRLEGWEVQLAVRAEAIRQFGDKEIEALPIEAAAVKNMVGGSR